MHHTFISLIRIKYHHSYSYMKYSLHSLVPTFSYCSERMQLHDHICFTKPLICLFRFTLINYIVFILLHTFLLLSSHIHVSLSSNRLSNNSIQHLQPSQNPKRISLKYNKNINLSFYSPAIATCINSYPTILCITNIISYLEFMFF